MMKHSKQRTYCQLVLAMAAALPGLSLAQVPVAPGEQEQQVQLGGSVYLETSNVWNANRTPVEDNEISEVQARYGAELMAKVNRELVELSADYNFYQSEFLEDTQDDRFIYTGRSLVVVGTENTFYQLEAGHSTQRFLLDPEGPSIISNTDQRNITTVAPLLRLQPSRVDSLSVQGHYADIRYKELDINNSERMGAGINWLHRTSPIYTYGIRALQNEIDYVVGDAADYKYRRATFAFDADLRKLHYAFEIGMNEAVPEMASSFDELYYDLSILYGLYRNTWSLSAQRSITDTSLGNANDPFFSEGITSDASNLVQDQLERYSYGLSWTSDFLCERCDVALRAGYEEEDYFHILTENQSETFVGARWAYRLRPQVILDVILDHRKRDFADGGRNVDYLESSAQIAIDFSELFLHFETRFWFEHEQRRPDQGRHYSANAVGVTLAYEFGDTGG